MNSIDHSLQVWLGVAAFFVLVGAVCYASLLPYMGNDE
jgi:hypothetical protein